MVILNCRGDEPVNTPRLDGLRKELEAATGQVAIVTDNHRHWYEAKSFACRVLGQPQAATDNKWTYADGKTVHFHTVWSPRVDMFRRRPIEGFGGTVLRFGLDACDEVHGIRG